MKDTEESHDFKGYLEDLIEDATNTDIRDGVFRAIVADSARRVLDEMTMRKTESLEVTTNERT